MATVYANCSGDIFFIVAGYSGVATLTFATERSCLYIKSKGQQPETQPPQYCICSAASWLAPGQRNVMSVSCGQVTVKCRGGPGEIDFVYKLNLRTSINKIYNGKGNFGVLAKGF